MFIRIFFTLIIVILTTSVQAIETLSTLYQLAEQHDPQFKIADSNRLITLESKPQIQATLKPQVTLSGSASEQFSTKNWITGDRYESTNLGYNISLNYALYRQDQHIALQQADSRIAQAETEYEAARQALMERVASRYFDLLASYDGIRFAQENKKAFAEQLKQAKERFEVGYIAITDVEEAQAAFDLATSELILAENQQDNAIESLREIIGTYHKSVATLKADAPLLIPDPTNVDKWTEIALERNPNIIAAQQTVEISRQEIDRQRAANDPVVNLFAEHRYSDSIRGDESSGLATSNSVGVQVTYSLYEGGAISSRIREAQQRHTQALDALEQQRRAVQRQTRNAYLNLESNISQVKALKQAVTSNETARNSVKESVAVGMRTAVDLVGAQRDLYQAQRNYSQARYNYVINTLRLKQAAGLLNAEDLVAISDWLNMTK